MAPVKPNRCANDCSMVVFQVASYMPPTSYMPLDATCCVFYCSFLSFIRSVVGEVPFYAVT